MSSAVKITASFLWFGDRTVNLFLTFWDHGKFKDYYVDTIKKLKTWIWQFCPRRIMSVNNVMPLTSQYCNHWMDCIVPPCLWFRPHPNGLTPILSSQERTVSKSLWGYHPEELVWQSLKSNSKGTQASLILCDFFLRDFALMQLENLYHFLNLCNNF
jgi:hypothetical protein